MSTPTSQEMWHQYRTRLLRFVRSKILNDEAAEDIVHDALVKAWTRRDTLRDGDALQPWLFQITMNAVRDYRRVRRPVMSTDVDVADQATSNDFTSMARCLESMIDSLDEPYRSAIQRSEIEGVPMRQIANELGISLSGVKSRVQRGRTKLKDMIVECCSIEVNNRGQITNSDVHQCTNPRCECQRGQFLAITTTKSDSENE